MLTWQYLKRGLLARRTLDWSQRTPASSSWWVPVRTTSLSARSSAKGVIRSLRSHGIPRVKRLRVLIGSISSWILAALVALFVRGAPGVRLRPPGIPGEHSRSPGRDIFAHDHIEMRSRCRRPRSVAVRRDRHEVEDVSSG